MLSFDLLVCSSLCVQVRRVLTLRILLWHKLYPSPLVGRNNSAFIPSFTSTLSRLLLIGRSNLASIPNFKSTMRDWWDLTCDMPSQRFLMVLYLLYYSSVKAAGHETSISWTSTGSRETSSRTSARVTSARVLCQVITIAVDSEERTHKIPLLWTQFVVHTHTEADSTMWPILDCEASIYSTGDVSQIVPVCFFWLHTHPMSRIVSVSF